jgi:hypothetical protein
MGINSLKIANWNAPVSITPLVHFRILFGVLMLASELRFLLKGWVDVQYVNPSFHFAYYGFEWVQYPGETFIYVLFGVMILACIGIILGFAYRISAWLFFIIFTYIELIDVTNYLNHYYFVSLVAFWMAIVPANKAASLDVKLGWTKPSSVVSFWHIGIIKFQLFLVYFYAGLAKLNYDWLINAQPLKIWLSAKSHLPIIGDLLTKNWLHYAFSWFGALYDLFIPFLLINRRTVKVAFVFVVVFHLMTAVLFQIGMFPYIMIVATTIFFSEKWHDKLFHKWNNQKTDVQYQPNFKFEQLKRALLITYLCWQVVFPFRFLAYPGTLFWTEQGYRFSWRVMLMEKAGYTTFYVQDAVTGDRITINNLDYLTRYQEKMMATQPDLILQFSHFLAKEYKKKGINTPKIYVESYVTLNGRTSQSFVDFNVNLSAEKQGWNHKNWILPVNL